MKQIKQNLNKMLGILLLSSLAACGNDDPSNPNYGYFNNDFYQQTLAQCGNAGIGNINTANMPYMQTVRGEDYGTVIQLTLYGSGNGQVGAVGTLQIPDLSKFGVGLYGPYNGCVSTQGANGFMQTSGTMDEIRVNLVGANGVTLVPNLNMGSRTPTVENQHLNGEFILSIQGRQIRLFF